LIVRLSAVGDVINVLPTLASLRAQRPDAYIAWAVEEAAADLLQGHPHLDEVIVVPLKSWKRSLPFGLVAGLKGLSELSSRLKNGAFDVTLDAHGNLKSGFVTRLSAAPRRVGFNRRHTREANHLFLTDAVDLPRPEPCRVLRALHLLTALGLEPRYVPTTLNLEARHRDEAGAALSSDRPLVVMHPGTSAFGAFKRWPAERFGQLAARLVERHDVQVLVTTGPGEEDLGRTAADASAGSARWLPPFQGGLRSFAALAQRATLVVAGDTGPLHLAAALDRPVVALFGPKDPAIYAPHCSHSRVVRQDLPCSPCRKRSCDHPICMTSLTVSQVANACDDLLNSMC